MKSISLSLILFCLVGCSPSNEEAPSNQTQVPIKPVQPIKPKAKPYIIQRAEQDLAQMKEQLKAMQAKTGVY